MIQGLFLRKGLLEALGSCDGLFFDSAASYLHLPCIVGVILGFEGTGLCNSSRCGDALLRGVA